MYNIHTKHKYTFMYHFKHHTTTIDRSQYTVTKSFNFFPSLHFLDFGRAVNITNVHISIGSHPTIWHQLITVPYQAYSNNNISSFRSRTTKLVHRRINIAARKLGLKTLFLPAATNTAKETRCDCPQSARKHPFLINKKSWIRRKLSKSVP